MRISISDLKETKLYQCFPEPFRKMGQDDYVVFFYEYDDKSSEIVDIKNVRVVPDIVMSLYNDMPSNPTTGIYYTFGFFKGYFDSQSALFYNVCKYYSTLFSFYDEKSAEINKKILINQFLIWRSRDIEEAKRTDVNTKHNNVFKVYSREMFSEAYTRFFLGDEEEKNITMSVIDSLNTFTKHKIRKNIYGEIINLIVTGIDSPNGGFIPEHDRPLKYFYIGEKSEVLRKDENLIKAKGLLRDKVPENEIYITTGWWYNSLDGRWRYIIQDKEATLESVEEGEMFVKAKMAWNGDTDKVAEMLFGDDEDRSKLAEVKNNGWDLYLSDILHHPTLYKHYPQLFTLPVFYGDSGIAARSGGQRAFYFSPTDNMIVIVGSVIDSDIRTILMHEVQHAIQFIEGFATGGDTRFAEMIQAIGGKNVKEFFYNIDFLTKAISKGVTPTGDFNHVVYTAYLSSGPLRDIPRDEYYKDPKTVAMEIISCYVLRITREEDKTKFLSNFKPELKDALEKLDELQKKSSSIRGYLKGQGLKDEQIKHLFFQTYEALAGEIEARDTQHRVNASYPIEDYFLPLTTEAIKPDTITVKIDENGEPTVVPPSVPLGAVELDEDGKYTIHIKPSFSPVPILHEVGHILYDIIGAEVVASAVDKVFTQEEIIKNGGVEEVFCEMFLCYLVRLSLSDYYSRLIGKGRKFLDNISLDDLFNDVFYAPVTSEDEYAPKLKFLKELQILIDNTIKR